MLKNSWLHGLIECFLPPNASKLTDTQGNSYRYWRINIVIATLLGYALIYWQRANLSMALPLMQEQLGYSKMQLAQISSGLFLIMCIFKSLSGWLSDKFLVRHLLIFSILGCSCVNLLMCSSTNIFLLSIIWSFNGIFQSIGWPCCTKLLKNWFLSYEIANKWAIASSSQQMGGLMLVLLLSLLNYFFISINYYMLFIIPALFSLIFLPYLNKISINNPQIVALAPLENYKKSPSMTLKAQALQGNKIFYSILLANFFVYMVRGITLWLPLIMLEYKNCNNLMRASILLIIMEIGGVLGNFLVGYLGNKYYNYRSKLGLFYSVAIGFCLLCFNYLNFNGLNVISLGILGLLLAGPQVLNGVLTNQISLEKTSGLAIGLIGTTAHLGSTLIQFLLAYCAQYYGWLWAINLLILFNFCAGLCFAYIYFCGERKVC